MDDGGNAFQTILYLVIAFGIIAISSHQIARVFQKIHLPLITGSIFTGILVGPDVLNLIPQSAIVDLKFLTDTALAFIAFAAGAELYLKELRGRINSIKWNTFGQLFITFLLGTVATYYLSGYLPFMDGLKSIERWAVAALVGTIFVARSPASAIAVINELRAKGPFVQTVMGVTVVKDFIVIIMFSVFFSLTQTILSGDPFDFLNLVILICEIGVSVVIGFYIVGRLIGFWLSLRAYTVSKSIFIILTGYGVYFLSHFVRDWSTDLGHEFHLEPLLICILASFHVTNFSKYRMEFIQILHKTGWIVYVAFFTLTGISLDLDTLSHAIWPVILLFSIRLITMIIGSYTGGVLARDPIKHLHFGWMPYLTQAGVALGLTTIVAQEWPAWGGYFSSIIVGMIVVNQFIGPPLFKFAIYHLGEDRTRASSKADNTRTAFIFGYEPLSIALANQLQEGGWTIQLVTLMPRGSFEESDKISSFHYIKSINNHELQHLNLKKAEAIITLLSDEENLEICEFAYHNFGTRDMVSRVENRNNTKKFMALDVKVVEPSTAVMNLLYHFVRSPQATSLFLGRESGQETRDIIVQDANYHGIPLRDLRLPQDVIILSINRGGQAIISHGYTRLRLNDVLTVVGSVKSLDEVQFRFDK